MQIKICDSIAEIAKQNWNSLLLDNNPFLRHEFLYALEKHNCVGEHFGWLPRHIAIYDDDQQLIAAMPLYEKYNSYGEFVFDNAWADAYRQYGLSYYPKLVAAVPYTPIIGQRLLARKSDQADVFPILLETIKQLAEAIQASSFHCLFANQTEHDWLQSQDLLTRHDCQFHWHNQNYTSFEDFLSKLTASKRKNIRQERRRVEQAGISFRRLSGNTATDEDWQIFTQFYQKTFDEKWGVATLNYEFFREVAQQLPNNVLLVLADKGDTCVAGALMYHSDDKLYGRHWGCSEYINSLHFEACYYQGIEYCIEQGLKSFEPGAQGEHKLARGFIPTLTRSNHWLASNQFLNAISNFTRHEQQAVLKYIEDLKQHLPYKSGFNDEKGVQCV
jgi:predicted N-acyltransferase